MQRVDGEVTEKRPEGKTGNSLGYWSGCPGVDGGGFGAVAVTAAVGVAAAVAALPLSDVLRWLLARSQVGWKE